MVHITGDYEDLCLACDDFLSVEVPNKRGMSPRLESPTVLQIRKI